MRILPVLAVIFGALGALAWACVYIVDEREQVLLLAFGRFERQVTEPGLYLKYPQPINSVVRFDDRILPLQVDEQEVNPLDGRRLVVTAFARYRITDPLQFFEAVGDQDGGDSRLEGILIDELRGVLGQVDSGQILSTERARLMEQIRDLAAAQAEAIGVTVVDVRIQSADLPPQNLAATYERMAADRQQLAAGIIASGNEQKQAREAQADREAVEIRALANLDAARRTGEADAERARITGAAYGIDPGFFQFYRSLQAAEATMTQDTSSFILTPGGEFTGAFFEAVTPTAPASPPGLPPALQE